MTEKNYQDIPSWLFPVCVAAVLLGALLTIAGLLVGDTKQVWWMLVVNFIFFYAVAQSMVVWSAIFRTAQATWAAGVSRIARSAVGFLPFGVLIFVVLFFGRTHWLPWIEHPLHNKSAWLNEGFFFSRNLIALIIMTVASFTYVKMASKDDVVDDHIAGRLNKFAIVLLLLYVTFFSMFAFDIVMSLEPHWYSTMFAPYFFIGSLYGALAVMILIATSMRYAFGLDKYIDANRFSDMGNLLMGFGMFFTGLMFAQWLTIWYAHIPEEISYLVPRYYTMPWMALFGFLLVILWLGPFFLLQSHKTKRTPGRLSIIAGMVLVGLFLERWLLVVPAFAKDHFAGITPLAWGIPLMCLGVFVIAVTSSLQNKPEVSKLDLALKLD